MAEITEERLRKIIEGSYCGFGEGVASAVKLVAVRAERDAARAQLQADDQRAWEALGKPEGTYSTTNVQRLCAEVERLRADMREAMELLRAHGEPPDWLRRAWLRGDPGDDTTPFHVWTRRYGALLAKHKETQK